MTPTQAKLATRQLVRDMVAEFGAERAAYYCSLGYSWSQAVAAHIDWLTAQNEQLRDRLALMDQAERMPLSQGGGDVVQQARKQGFEQRLNLR